MYRRWHRLGITLLAAVGLFATIIANAAGVEITHYSYGAHGDAWLTYLRTMAERFEGETGISVNIMVSGNPSDYRDKLFTMIAVGAPPDVTDANPAAAGAFLGQGSFADLRPYIERDGFPLDQIPPAALQGVQAPDGTLWGIPVSVFPIVTFYNEDMFNERGIQTPAELGDNWTWDTMYDAAKRLTYDTNGDGAIDVYASSRFHWRWEMQVHQAGGRLYDQLIFPSESRFNSPEVLTAIEFLRDFVVTDQLNAPNYRTHDLPNGNVAFTVVDGPGLIGNALGAVTFSWDVGLQPKGPANRAARVNPDGFQMLADSTNPDAAWQWIKYLTADAHRQLEMAKITGRMPSLRGAMLEYPEVVPTLPDNWMAIVDTAFDPDGYAAYVVPNSTSIDPIVNPNLDRVWQGVTPPALALEQIHTLVSGVLAAQ